MTTGDVPATAAGGTEQPQPVTRGWYWAEPQSGPAAGLGTGFGMLEVVFVYFIGRGTERLGVVCALQENATPANRYRRLDEFRWYGPAVSPADRENAVSSLESVLHQLRRGEASEGDPRDIEWCAEQVNDALDRLSGRYPRLPPGYPASSSLGAPELGFLAPAEEETRGR